MRLQQHIRHNHFVFQFRMLPFVARILIRPDVIPGPAIKSAVLHARDVIGHQIVSEIVTFVTDAHSTPVEGSIAIPTGFRIPAA